MKLPTTPGEAMNQPDNTITVQEWADVTVVGPLDRIQLQWPWLRCEVSGVGGASHIKALTDRFCAGVRLVNSGEPNIWIPQGYVGQTSTMNGTIASCRVHALTILAVCDAVDMARYMLTGVRVWWP